MIKCNQPQAHPDRSPWFKGLLDAEAECLVEPCDWDWGTPEYWREYSQGARDYKEHITKIRSVASDTQES